MQTFVPFADFDESARVLDDRRLGKQRVETLQIMRALTIPTYGWQNHPVTRMWRGYRAALMDYQEATCAEWVRRGFGDTCLEKTLDDLATAPADLDAYIGETFERPPWLADESIMISHRSNLLRKYPEFYAPLFPDVPPDLDYVWPVTGPTA
jgi:hypothetical protein